MRSLDDFLNRITMYHLVFYVLAAWTGAAALLGFLGALHYNGWSILATTLLIVGVAWTTNAVFAWAFGAPRHDDSAYITGLILALIISPIRTNADLPLVFWAPILAMAGKYILAIRKQHVFNPAALAVAVAALTIHASATWWVGNLPMLPVVAVGGFLVLKKLRRWDVVTMFLVTALVMMLIMSFGKATFGLDILRRTLTASPLLFFASIMLTEPLTMPPTRQWRIMYGAFVGLLFAPQVHLGSIYSTPELALLSGNILFFLIRPRARYLLHLRKKIQVAPSIVDFVFDGPQPKFLPGQYFEWTLPHQKSDNRGSRRYFTVASSPTEKGLRIGVKFTKDASTYKRVLYYLEKGQTIIASQRDGDFTLPKDPQQKCLFIAGGIGVTPYRSMIKYLLDKNERRSITLIYTNRTAADIVYQDVFAEASIRLGIKTVYVVTENGDMPAGWMGRVERITAETIREEVPDYRERLVYLSGPQGMVTAYVDLFRSLGVPRKMMKTDYFPGFA